MNEAFETLEIWEAERSAVVEALTAPGSKARNRRGSLAVSKFKQIGKRVWPSNHRTGMRLDPELTGPCGYSGGVWPVCCPLSSTRPIPKPQTINGGVNFSRWIGRSLGCGLRRTGDGEKPSMH